MATKSDLIEAQNFSRRRLLTAFTSGAPEGKELEPAAPLRAVIAAIALTAAVVLVASRLALGIVALAATPLVAAANAAGGRYVVAGGTSHLVDAASGDAVLRAAGIAASTPRAVSVDWLNLFTPGAPLAPLTVTDASIHGPHVALAAPGQDILTTSTQGGDCIYVSDKPATSFATAYVSAAAALVAAAYPQETPAQWAYRLEVTAVRANPDQRTDAAAQSTSGRSDSTGARWMRSATEVRTSPATPRRGG
ncbi:hypothetical protein CJ026_026315 [Ralstonia pickettii]|uniref:S8 family serine peptidase n=1 Tax=Ralstonia pickettii TaxID=329 RepID=UPI000CD4A097|nr:hypothetical protein CJ026_026315 [Ralstonia pickettii]